MPGVTAEMKAVCNVHSSTEIVNFYSVKIC